MSSNCCSSSSRRDGGQVLVLPELPVGPDAEAGLGGVAVAGRPLLLGLEAGPLGCDALPAPVLAAQERALRRGDPHQLPAHDADPSPRDDHALDHPIAELLFVVVPLPVPVVDAAHGRMPPVDDADALARVDVRAGTQKDVSTPLGRASGAPLAGGNGLLEAHVPEVRARRVDGAADAPAPLPAQRRQVVHLLEERRQVLGLRHRDVVAQLEHPRFVERPAPRRRYVGSGARIQRGPHGAQELELLQDHARTLGVVLQTRNGRRGLGSAWSG